MVDITQKPYFYYDDIIDTLSESIRTQADVQLVWFRRLFKNGERFLIVRHKRLCVDYYTMKLYTYGVFEKKQQDLSSAFHMWDHFSYTPPEIYDYNKQLGLAHGLTIMQQYDHFTDGFTFATHLGNHQANNFYLNQKDLFSIFMEEFYTKMATVLKDLSTQTFMVPSSTKLITPPMMTLSPRQLDCAQLLFKGANTKEIAAQLDLSPRTVEEHIRLLKTKFEAKNRMQLMGSLTKYF